MRRIAATIRVEALRLARLVVKARIVEFGGRVADYPSADINKTARLYLEQCAGGKKLIRRARYNVNKALANPKRIS